MNNTKAEQHLDALNRLIVLANEIKDEGVDVKIVGAAMLSATSIYTTYAQAGNDGFLQPSGVEKVIDEFRSHLQLVQAKKRDALEAKGHTVDSPSPRVNPDAQKH